ncbi:uncharacterized protein LOC119081497 isoform X1 [Bradysia coprophila]|uniref:uncharacterized protein LOC119081497 isoform X1 n=1 Tax=Bradysia coprophila TaxID=38358 RepID=UPI00187DC75D|nr:uncharacterized protein LOC119081497 isoform X1 [Bradysia coprophila]
MKAVLVIFVCIVAISNAIPLSDSSKETLTSNFDSNGPQPVDDIIAITDDDEVTPSKRVARHYGGVSVGIGVPVVVGKLDMVDMAVMVDMVDMAAMVDMEAMVDMAAIVDMVATEDMVTHIMAIITTTITVGKNKLAQIFIL